MKKLLASAAASAVMLGTLAVPVFASPPGPYEQPGYDVAVGNTECTDAGAFGYFGNYGEFHDVNGYDQESDTEDDNVGNGAEGGTDEGTGDRNSDLCGSPQNENF